MMDHIVVDVEIARTIEQVGGWGATDQMGVACAVVYEFANDRYRVYGPTDVEMLKERLLAAGRVTTFNGWKFDFPVIWGLPGRERVEDMRWKSDDLLGRIWLAQGLDPESFGPKHAGWGLDNVARGTLNAGKIGNGADAPKWFQAGEWAKLVSYCADDVTLTRNLCSFMDKYGFVVRDAPRQVLRVSEDWCRKA